MLNTPGFSRQSQLVRRRVWDIAQRNGWEVDALIAAIEHESAWVPTAVNPTSGATGLIQWMPATAKSQGTTVAAIRSMTPEQQLELAEQYWQRVNAQYPLGRWDFLAALLGVGLCPPGPLDDSCVMYAAGSAGAVGNPGLTDETGAITVGGMRAYTRMYEEQFGGRPPLDVPPAESAKSESAVQKPSRSSGGMLFGALTLVGFGWLLYRGIR